MNIPPRAILLATAAASLAVHGWAQPPQLDPLLNRTKDPPDVYTIGSVNGAKMLFRIAFFPYDQRYIVYQAPITLQPATPTGRTAPAATAPRLAGDSDADNFPPDLPPIPPAGLSTAPQGDTENGPPDPEPFQALPWELPDPIDDFTLPASVAVLPDPFATAVSPPILAGDTIPWVDLSDGALNITNSRQPIGEVTTANATSISVGPAPAGIVISRDLTTAYVAVSGAGQVAVVDLTAKSGEVHHQFPWSHAILARNHTG